MTKSKIKLTWSNIGEYDASYTLIMCIILGTFVSLPFIILIQLLIIIKKQLRNFIKFILKE